MVLDVVDLNFESRSLMMIWRVTIPCTPADHHSTCVRELETWEDTPS
ncbi:hypothetical protein DB30_04226 [Enhygromyxa salina]|uniref:Uncharacterized protein n=2 Tax=Enhygromyxa salina TaxID=215803 RepID=A0A0C2D9D4_9BACT|nr:hypothetical protein DB30_04226 [Enhygromyxa salina]